MVGSGTGQFDRIRIRPKGSERIRIRNTVGTYAFETGSGLTVLINALVILSNIRSQIRSKGSTWAGPAYPSQPYTD